MTTIRELEARITATVNGFRNATNLIRADLNNVDRETRHTTQQSSKYFKNVIQTLNTLRNSLTQAFGQGSSQLQNFNQIIQQVQTEFNQTGNISSNSMNLIQQAVQQATQELTQMNNVSSHTLQQMQADLNAAQTELEQLRTELTEANRKLDDLGNGGNLDEVSDDINQVDDNTQNLTGSLVKGAAKVIAFVGAFMGMGAVVSMTDELQQALDKLQNNTGATKGEIDGMRDSLVNVYKSNYGESFMDIADAMSTIKTSTKLTGEALEEATKHALELRNSFGWDITESMRAAKSMMTEFGYSAEEAFTILAQGQQAGSNLSEDLLDTFNEYSSAWHDIGFNGEQAMNMINSGIEAGARNSDVIGDMVNEFATRIFDGSTTTTDALGLLGLNVDDTVERFKKGGPEATGAFQDIIKAIQNTEDAQLRENAAVGLFGSLAEDNGLRVIASLGKVDGQVDKTADTLEKMGANGFNTIGEVAQFVGRNIMANIVLPLQEKVMPVINDFIKNTGTGISGLKKLFSGDEVGFAETVTKGFGQENGLKVMKFFFAVKDGFNSAKEAIQPFRDGLQGLFAMFSGDFAGGRSILQRLGLTSDQVEIIKRYIMLIQKAINGFISGAQSAFSNLGDTFRKIWDFLGPYVKPLLQDISNFFFGIVSKITSFWEQNGSMIMTAAKNVFGFILSTIKFIMPAVLFIIETVWGNIKGVINGALNIIMGAVKLFAGLFTGNWSKLWEGVKQLLKGALEFAWNLFNLLMLGKLITGIKTLGIRAVAYFKDMWTKAVQIFRNMDNQIVNIASNLVSRVLGFFRNFYNTFRQIFQTARTFGVNTFNALRDGVVGAGRRLVDNVLSGFRSMKNQAVSIFSDLRGRVSSVFNNIVDGAKALPGKIGNGIKNMAGKAMSGIRSLANTMTKGLAAGVNGVIGGINWAMDKVGVNKKLTKWEPSRYAKGTEAHPGGLAIVGDGKKRELVILPDGQMFMSPNTDTMVNLPKGTQVISGPNTEKLVPQYAKGTGIINKAAGAIGKGAGWVKDKALDVWDYVSNPSKLFTMLLDKFGVKTPSFPGELKDFGKGAFTKVKDGMKGYLKKMIDSVQDSFGGGEGGSSVNITGGAAKWRGQIMRAAQAFNETLSGREIQGIIAQIQRESGGNQRIVQSPLVDDVNTRNGNPARGLLQYIPQTFRAYAVKGYNNIYDGYHQLLAFFNNRTWRRDLPYGTRGWGPRGGRRINGFWEGARVAAKQMAWIAEKGAEYIIPTDGGQRAYDLWKQAGVENGFSGSIDNNVSMKANIELTTNINGKTLARETHKDITLYQNQSKRQAQNNGKAKVRQS